MHGILHSKRSQVPVKIEELEGISYNGFQVLSEQSRIEGYDLFSPGRRQEKEKEGGRGHTFFFLVSVQPHIWVSVPV